VIKISVVTAVRNGLTSVPRTIDSVRSQSYPALEYVVVDGASTDGTVEYLQSRRADITVLQSEPDSGIYDAFNKGLALATGDVIGYLNAGDVLADTSVIERLASIFADSSIEAVFGDVAITRDAELKHITRLYRSSIFSPSRARFGFMPAHPTLYMRRSVYEAVGPYDASYRVAGDFELVLRAFVKRQTRYRYLPQTLVRMPVGGVSNRGIRSKLRITVEMKRACVKNDLATSTLYLSLRFPIKMLELFRRGDAGSFAVQSKR
jgi:glycosyltransferase involved in cell wall biosynthesis